MVRQEAFHPRSAPVGDGPDEPGPARASLSRSGARSVESVDQRREIREFLSSRRAKITPQQAGLPAWGGTRRVPGLRREEVALLAGVSIDYYTRLERGSLDSASDSVLDAIATLSSSMRPSAPTSTTWRAPRRPVPAAGAVRHVRRASDPSCNGSSTP